MLVSSFIYRNLYICDLQLLSFLSLSPGLLIYNSGFRVTTVDKNFEIPQRSNKMFSPKFTSKKGVGRNFWMKHSVSSGALISERDGLPAVPWTHGRAVLPALGRAAQTVGVGVCGPGSDLESGKGMAAVQLGPCAIMRGSCWLAALCRKNSSLVCRPCCGVRLLFLPKANYLKGSRAPTYRQLGFQQFVTKTVVLNLKTFFPHSSSNKRNKRLIEIYVRSNLGVLMYV